MRANLLIIDDDAVVAEMIAVCLERAGFAVRMQTGGDSGVRSAREWKPDIIISDLNMPLVTGSTVRNALSNDDTTRDIPIIFISGSGEPPGLTNERRWFLQKPFTADQILAAAERAFAVLK